MDDAHGMDEGWARDRAHTGSILGLIATSLCMLGCCFSGMTIVPAFFVSLLGVFYTRAALADTDDEVALALGKYALATNLIALLYSIVILAIIAAYVGMYAVMIFFAIFAAAAGA